MDCGAFGTLHNPKLQVFFRPKLHRFSGTVKTENLPMKQTATGLRRLSGDLLDLTNDGKFNIHGTVHRSMTSSNNQQDAT